MRKFLRLTGGDGKTRLPPILAMPIDCNPRENYRPDWGKYTTRETAKGHSPLQTLDYISLKRSRKGLSYEVEIHGEPWQRHGQ